MRSASRVCLTWVEGKTVGRARICGPPFSDGAPGLQPCRCRSEHTGWAAPPRDHFRSRPCRAPQNPQKLLPNHFDMCPHIKIVALFINWRTRFVGHADENKDDGHDEGTHDHPSDGATEMDELVSSRAPAKINSQNANKKASGVRILHLLFSLSICVRLKVAACR